MSDYVEHIGNGAPARDQFNPLTGNFDDDYTWRIRMMIEDARSYNDDYRAPKREVCMEYYLGLKPDLDREGRSSFVATEARDTILAIMPSLLRIFTAREHVCEYVPNFPEQVPLAAQATDYVHTVFKDDNAGFMIYHNWFKDALTKGEGIVRWWTDNNPEVTRAAYRGVTEMQIQLMLAESPHATLESIHHSTVVPQPQPAQPGGAEPAVPSGVGAPQGAGGMPAPIASPEPLYDVVVRFERPRPRHFIEGVPPDEFRIDRFARSLKDAVLVGHESVKSPSDLRKLGYSEETIDEFAGQDVASVRWNLERSLRNPALDQGIGSPGLYGGINYGEYYIRVDKDGDGIDELRHICVMGNADVVVHDEPVEYTPYAYLTPDPEPHTVVGHSITELVEDLQRIKTNLLRNSLDSIASTIYPRLVFNELVTNPDDVLNDELGAPIRSKDPVAGIQQLQTTFVGDAPMSMVNYLDMVRMQRTGISDASKGLDPKALQSTASQGVDMVITGAQERIELIARILAETGVKEMFVGLLKEISNSPNYTIMKRIRGNFVPINPSLFDPSMGMQVNPALGKSSDNDRMATLMAIKATQEAIMSTQGVSNPLCGPLEYRATLEDLAGLGGIKDVSRYFRNVTPEEIQQFLSQPKPPSPMELQAQIDQEKLRYQTVKHIADDAYRQGKQEQDERFRRDKLVSDTMAKELQAEAMAKVPLQEAAIQAQIDRDQMDSDERVAYAKHASDERIASERHATQREVAASRSTPAQPAAS